MELIGGSFNDVAGLVDKEYSYELDYDKDSPTFLPNNYLINWIKENIDDSVIEIGVVMRRRISYITSDGEKDVILTNEQMQNLQDSVKSHKLSLERKKKLNKLLGNSR